MVDIKPEYIKALASELVQNKQLKPINYKPGLFKKRIYKTLKCSYFQNFYDADGAMSGQEQHEPGETKESKKAVIIDFLRTIRNKEDIIIGKGRVFGYSYESGYVYFVFLRDVLGYDLWLFL